ncbi:MAG: DEAD/DEAH box helicase [Croceibacterium sp.]
MKFADLGLSDELLKAVEEAGYSEPTPIQAQAIPQVQMMKDIIAIAQTGTGKTASFVLPMIDVLASGRRRALMPRSLILEPTRELAVQVAENFEKYGKNHDLKMALLIGGVQMGDQLKALNEGVDVLIATPGRLMDLFQRGKIMLNGCDLLVIDEADRMLDMGFIPDIEFICEKLPTSRQTLLFSATMPPPIKKLADRFLSNPKYIEVARPASANLNIAQHKVFTSSRGKRDVLRTLLRSEDVQTGIIFANRKTTVRELNKMLRSAGFNSGEIHGDMDQSSRSAELERFKTGAINILVASDVAARGLDVKGVSHVFNYDTPWHPDDYVHRIGRTGRAGAKGRAFTLVTPEDAEAVANVEKLTGTVIPVFDMDGGAAAPAVEAEREPRKAAADKPARGRKRAEPKAPRAEVVADVVVEAEAEAEAVEAVVAAPKQRRAPRARAPRPVEAAVPAVEPEIAREAEPAAERTPAPERAADRAPERPAHRDAPVNRNAPGEWNGPVPGFLNFSAL